MPNLYSEWWATAGPSFLPPTSPRTHLKPIYHTKDCDCFSGKTEAPRRKKCLQMLTFGGSLQKSWPITPPPQYPSGPTSHAPFSLKLSWIWMWSSLVLSPWHLPRTSHRLSVTVATPVLPHSTYKMISFSRARTVSVISTSPSLPPKPTGVRGAPKHQCNEFLLSP